jgi:hypothetical protein
MKHEAQVEKNRHAYRILGENAEGRRPLVRPRCRSVNSIKMDLKEIRWVG